MQKIKKNNKGFTLVELIVVIAILGVLAAVLVPQYIQYVNKSRAGSDLYTLGEALHAAEIYAATQETTPTITMSMTAGVITVDSDIDDVLGTTITLKSNEAKLLTDTTLAITFSSGKAGWGTGSPVTGSKTTETHFTTIAAAD